MRRGAATQNRGRPLAGKSPSGSVPASPFAGTVWARMRLAAAALGVIVLAAALSPAADGPVPADRRPLEYYRVFVPQDRLRELARDDLPIRKDEFQRLLDAIAASAAAPVPSGAWIVEADYAARLEGEQLVGGRAALAIGHAATGPSAASFDGCRLALGNARWNETPPLPAALGLAPDGKLALLVDKPGELLVDWSLRGRREADGSLSFSLALPRSPIHRLFLDLPADMTPAVEHAVITPIAADAPTGRIADAPTPAAAGTAQAAAPTRRWQIELGWRNQAELRVVSAETAEGQPTGLVLARQSATYELSERGLELAMQLVLDIHAQPIRRLPLELDAELKLTSARYGDKPIAWTETSPEPVAASPASARRIELLLPAPLAGNDVQLQLRALAPLRTDLLWRLPAIRLPDSYWQEGSARLLVPAPLSIHRIEARGCRQTEVTPLAAPRRGESLAFQFFRPDAAIEVAVGRVEPRLELSAGTRIEFAPSSTTGQMNVQIAARSGDVFALEADLPAAWVVNSVATVPADALDDWSLAPGLGQQQVLTVRLKRAIGPPPGLRVAISAHRRPPAPGEEFSASYFRLADFRDAQTARRLAAVGVAGANRLEISGDAELARLDPLSLEPADAALLAPQPADLAYIDDAGSRRLRVAIRAEPAAYSGEIEVALAAHGGTLGESYVVRVAPESPVLSRVLVHFFPAGKKPLQWLLEGEDAGSLAARRLDSEEQQELSLAGMGETWEIALARPRGTPFVLRGQRTEEFAPPAAVPLAALPEARTQRASLSIASSGEVSLTMENRGLKQIPPVPAAASGIPGARAAFRYDPVGDVLSAAAPVFHLGRAASAGGPPAAWAWRCRVETRAAADGSLAHAARYFIESMGARLVRLRLPEGAAFRRATVDGREVAPAARGSSDGAIALPLPAGDRFPLLVVEWTSRRPALGWFDRLDAPRPELDVPVLEQQWEVWLPPDYAPLADGAARASLAERLFGSLCRPAGERPFNLFDAGDWLALAASIRSQPNPPPAAEAALAVLAEPAENPAAALTWGERLARYEQRRRAMPESIPLILVDEAAIEAEGVGFSTSVRPGRDDETQDTPTPAILLHRARELLARHNLALVEANGVVLLTSGGELARHRSELELFGTGPIAVAGPGRLADDIAAAARQPARWIPLDAWLAAPRVAGSPWPSDGRGAYESSGDAGWSAHTLEVIAGTPRHFSIHRRSPRHALGWLVLLGAATAAWWGARRHPIRWLIALSVAAVLAMLLPEAFVPIGAGLFCGVLLAGAFLVVWPRRGGDSRPGPASTVIVPAARGAAAVASILAAAAMAGLAARNGAAVEGEPPAAAALYRVVVPVDAGRKPVGEYYYLPREFYDAIHRRAAAARSTPRAWLIRSAHYRGALERQIAPATFDLAELTATYEIETYQAAALVLLPLAREGVNLVEGGARLDAQPIEFDWDADGRNLLVNIPLPGRYRLDLTFRPTLRAAGRSTGFDLAVPPLAAARLELALPLNAPPVELPTARGAAIHNAGTGQLAAELGPAERLTVAWPSGPDSEATQADLRQYVWLRVRPGSVLIDTRFRIRVMQGQVSRLRLSVDPRLRLLPLSPEQPVARVVTREEAAADVHEFVFAQPAADEVSMAASFLVRGTSGFGNVRLPRIEAQGITVSERLLAVSVDSTLAYEEGEPPVQPLTALGAADFAAAWGNDPAPPQLTYRLPPRGETAWSLSTRPAEPATTVSEELTVTVSRSAAHVALAARLDTKGGYVFHHRLRAPPGFVVDQALLAIDEATSPVRWSVDAEGLVTVFLGRPVSGPHRLTVQGRLPLATPRRMTLPALKLEGAELLSGRARVYRQSDVLVDVVRTEGLSAIAGQSQADGPAPPGRLVGAWKADAARTEIVANVSVNDPLVSGKLITLVRRQRDSFTTTFICRLAVERGVVDVLRFDVPPTWQQSPAADLPAQLELADVPGESRRRLTARLAEPAAGRFEFRITRASSLAPTDRAGISDVRLLDAEPLERLVVVPNEIDGRPLTWETRGLRAVPLPDDALLPGDDPGRFAAYQVVGREFGANLERVQRVADLPQVRLADIHLAWRGDGTYYGVAGFDLEPADLASCTLEMPAESRLVQASVAGLPAMLRAVGPNQWQLPLAAANLPQRIEVVYEVRGDGRSADAAGWKARAPELRGLEVERTLWTIRPPPGIEPLAPLAGNGRPSAVRQNMFRLKSAAAVIELSGNVLAESDPGDLDRWYFRWKRRMAMLRGQIERQSRLPGMSDVPHPDELAQIDEWQAAQAERLGIATAEGAPSVESLIGPVEWSWGAGEAAAGRLVRQVQTGAPGTGEMRAAAPPGAWGRWAAALAWASCGALAGIAVRRGNVAEELARWPLAAGVAFGLVWWLWLWPSLVGWLIVAACLLLLTRFPGRWAGTMREPPPSTAAWQKTEARSGR